MKPVCIIPAKGYSARLADKNKLEVGGVPLWQRAFDAGMDSGVFDATLISSDDRDIIKGRNPILSRPGVGYNAVVFDLLSQYSYKWDSFCVLIPTSPLRTPELIKDIYNKFVETDADCMMTFAPGYGVHDGTAIFAKTVPFLRALDFHKMNYVPYVVCPNLSCDVNTQEDLDRAREMFEGRAEGEMSRQFIRKMEDEIQSQR